MSETIVSIVFFGCLAALILVPRFFRFLERKKALETLQTAYERGQPVPPEFIASVMQTPRARLRSRRPGSAHVENNMVKCSTVVILVG